MDLNWNSKNSKSEDNGLVEVNRYTGKESKLQKINTRYRDAEVKNRFTKIKGYKEDFVKIINDKLNIEGQTLGVENLHALEGVILERFRTNDILLRANVRNGNSTTGIFYYFVEAQSSRDYFIFDRIIHYYHLLLEDILGGDMHNIKSMESIRRAYKTLGMPIFVVLNNSSIPTKYGVETGEVVSMFKYSKYRSLYDDNYNKDYSMEYTMFLIEDERLEELGDEYSTVKLYSRMKNRRELEDMKYNFDLSNEELEAIKESMYEKDLSEDYIEEGREDTLREVVQRMAAKNISIDSISDILAIPIEEVEEKLRF